MVGSPDDPGRGRGRSLMTVAGLGRGLAGGSRSVALAVAWARFGAGSLMDCWGFAVAC